MESQALSAEQIQGFEENGYLILESLIDPEDAELILRIADRNYDLRAEL